MPHSQLLGPRFQTLRTIARYQQAHGVAAVHWLSAGHETNGEASVSARPATEAKHAHARSLREANTKGTIIGMVGLRPHVGMVGLRPHVGMVGLRPHVGTVGRQRLAPARCCLFPPVDWVAVGDERGGEVGVGEVAELPQLFGRSAVAMDDLVGLERVYVSCAPGMNSVLYMPE